MSRDDLQETNTAKEKPLTIDDVRRAIVGDENKFIVLNVVDNLINENKQLKDELKKFQEVKSFEE
jgi:hypothetical protein